MKEYYGTKFASLRSCSINTPTKDIQMTQIIANAPINTTTSWIIAGTKQKSELKRKLSITLTALLLGIYGIILLPLVFTHFDQSMSHCSSIVDELQNIDQLSINSTNIYDGIFLKQNQRTILELHPELFLYDYCEFQVYPFGTDNHGYPLCDCRQYHSRRIKQDPLYKNKIITIPDLQTHFNIDFIDMLSGMLRNWKMLEKFAWQDTEKIYQYSNDNENGISYKPRYFNFTNDMFIASKMRVFQMTFTPNLYIDDAISNWRLLSFFEVRNNADFTVKYGLPSSFGTLSELRYFEISQMISVTEFPHQICNLNKLTALNMELTAIESIPKCIIELRELESILFGAAGFIHSFPIQLLDNEYFPNLEIVSAASSDALTLNTLIISNNFSNFTAFDAAFNYDPEKDTQYWFDHAGFCDDFYNELIPNNSKFYRWIKDESICVTACEITGELWDIAACLNYLYQNGICDEQCNRNDCNWDGGDCTQICDCDPFQELGNGICNISCNTTNCQYDGGDCLPLGYDPNHCVETYQLELHDCNESWIGDNWCDNNCRYVSQCGNDLEDCDDKHQDCKTGSECGTFYAGFKLAANEYTNDNHIEQTEIDRWWDLGIAFGLFDGTSALYNKSTVISYADANDDGIINLHEAIVMVHEELGISKAQARQIDCSPCVGGIDAFYN